jgi:hypothetical protein
LVEDTYRTTAYFIAVEYEVVSIGAYGTWVAVE